MELHTILGMLWQFTSYNEYTLRMHITATDTNAIQSHLFDGGSDTNFIGDTSSDQSRSTDHESSDRKETNSIRFESVLLRPMLLWL